MRVVPAVGLDTDLLGTFSGEIPRQGTMLEVAVRKARSKTENAMPQLSHPWFWSHWKPEGVAVRGLRYFNRDGAFREFRPLGVRFCRGTGKARRPARGAGAVLSGMQPLKPAAGPARSQKTSAGVSLRLSSRRLNP